MNFSEFFNILSQNFRDTSFAELVAVITGIGSVLFARKENILVYPVGIVSVLIYVYLCFIVGLYAEMGINGFYFVMSVYGWYYWAHRGAHEEKTPITRCNTREHLFNGVLLVLSFLVLWLVLEHYTNSTVPVLDALTTAIFIVAMWQMARKKIENWITYFVGNLICVPFYFYKGLALTSIQFLVFVVLAVMGYLSWRIILQKNQQLA